MLATTGSFAFRAVLFTDEPMTAEAYGLIYNSIAVKLEEAGYLVEKPGRKLKTANASNFRPSGLDWSKSFPTSLVYFPCQAQCADDSFFIEKMEGRYPLNPSRWIENTTVPLQPTLEPVEPDTQENGVDWKRVQLASKWQKGTGNALFFDLAVSLKRAGMAFPEIESTLHAEAHYARSPQKRLAQIPSIMNSLRTYSASWTRRGKTPAIVVEAS
jgi:hypothetical protein